MKRYSLVLAVLLILGGLLPIACGSAPTAPGTASVPTPVPTAIPTPVPTAVGYIEALGYNYPITLAYSVGNVYTPVTVIVSGYTGTASATIYGNVGETYESIAYCSGVSLLYVEIVYSKNPAPVSAPLATCQSSSSGLYLSGRMQ